MMRGLFPPSSRLTLFKLLSAAATKIFLPVYSEKSDQISNSRPNFKQSPKKAKLLIYGLFLIAIFFVKSAQLHQFKLPTRIINYIDPNFEIKSLTVL